MKELFEAVCTMQTTAEIAGWLDKVLEEIGNADGSVEITAAVIVAMIKSGKGTIHMQDVS